MINLTWKDIKNKNIAILVKNDEESKQLFNILRKYSEDFNNNWIVGYDDICYSVENDGSWSWCESNFYLEDEDVEWKIIKFTDINFID